MEDRRGHRKVAAFKGVYGNGSERSRFALDDPTIGLPVIQKAHDLGVKTFIAHKGLPLVRFDAAHNRPDDIVAVSRQFPRYAFVVFHGAWDKNHIEGPRPNASIGDRQRSYALGQSCGTGSMTTVGRCRYRLARGTSRPTTAAHTLGKLLKAASVSTASLGYRCHLVRITPSAAPGVRAFAISTEYQIVSAIPH